MLPLCHFLDDIVFTGGEEFIMVRYCRWIYLFVKLLLNEKSR